METEISRRQKKRQKAPQTDHNNENKQKITTPSESHKILYKEFRGVAQKYQKCVRNSCFLMG